MASLWKTIFYLGVMTLPFYPFASGGVQPSHALLALAFGIMLVHKGFRLQMDLLIKVYMFMTVYVMLRELTVTMNNSDIASLLSPIYFVFNLMVLMLVYHVDEERSNLKMAVILGGCIATLGVLILGVSFVRAETTFRAIGTFNNPNQLGYFSVCFLSMSYLLYSCGRVSTRFFLVLMGIGFFCGFVSLSKSAIVSNLMVLIAFLLSINLKKKVIVFFSLCAAIVIVITNDLIPMELIQSSELYYRFDKLGQESDSSLASRGYLLFFESGPIELLFGMGSEGVKAFFGQETHSSIISMLNSYGLIGLFVFLFLLAIWFLKVNQAFGFVGFLGICTPAVLYGLAHNGNRFVMFWLLVAMSVSMARTTIQARRERFTENTAPEQPVQAQPAGLN